MKDHPFISGFVLGLIVFFALAAAVFMIFPELIYVMRELGKFISGGI